MSIYQRTFICCLISLSLGLSAPALAWGPNGHALIADMAGQQLTAQARQRVQKLLATEDLTSLADVASWADAERDQYPRSREWHYVDIPLSASHYLATRDCPGNACVVAQLVRFSQILVAPDTTKAERLQALKYVVHFVADIQQPLHASNNNDYGGNTVKLTYFGRRTNLHQIWDSRILERALDLRLKPHYQVNEARVSHAAARLLGDTTAAERHRWTNAVDARHLKRSAIAWANEAHRLAVSTAYGNLPKHRRGRWAQRYQLKAWPVVEQQLQRGGVRLAAVLNSALDSP